MRETVDRVNADFTRFEQEAARARENSAAEFSAQAAALRTEMDGVEQELNALKNKAYDNVSEKLKVFEDDFFAGLSKRGENIERRLEDWQKAMESRLAEMGSREERVEATWQRLNKEIPDVTAALAREAGLDFATAATDLGMMDFAHKAALQTAAKILPTTLLDFLR
jgi:flagellin-like hook-associated protein FlgL